MAGLSLLLIKVCQPSAYPNSGHILVWTLPAKMHLKSLFLITSSVPFCLLNKIFYSASKYYSTLRYLIVLLTTGWCLCLWVEGSGVGSQCWSLKNGQLTSSFALPSLTAVLHKNGLQVGPYIELLCWHHIYCHSIFNQHVRSVWPVLCHTFVFHCLPHLGIAFFCSLF